MLTHALTQSHGLPAPRRPRPLAQVEVLLLFHPRVQTGGTRRVSVDICARATQGWLTWDVYGDGGLSEIAARPVMENLRLEAGGADLEPLLLDGIVSEVADYVPGLE